MYSPPKSLLYKTQGMLPLRQEMAGSQAGPSAKILVTEKLMGGPTAGARATKPQASPPLALGVEHPSYGSGVFRGTDTTQRVSEVLANAPNSLQSAPPAKVAGCTSSCMQLLLGTSCVTPAPRSRSLDCKDADGTTVGRRPP